ncbi:MAG: LysM peptidoglycan-binding domain-containing protein [Clostridiaceae bacterium]|nr:LysM peptidoglycan-binding domain-containing protein [Clostridiaceae bacterium]
MRAVKGLAAVAVSTLLFVHSLIPAFASGNDYVIYTVVSGDSLWKISNKYGVSIQEITELNSLTGTIILVGQKLKIPVSTPQSNSIVYTVKSGDTLWKIASAYNTSIQAIVDANKIDPNQYLMIGQKLYIPAVENNTQPYVTYVEHVVQKGDNVWDLSIKYGIPQNEILEANNLTVQSVLYIGQKLKIPVHHVPVTSTPGPQYGEYLDWWTQAQYLFPIGAKAKVTDFATGRSYNVIRSFGAFHADCEPLTARDASIMYEIWGNEWSWQARASIVEVNGRKIAASVSNMPHDIENIKDNQFNGHFDVHFLNSTRHKDNQVSQEHQTQIKIAAGRK